MKKKLTWQIAALVIVAGSFLAIDLTIFFGVTKRCIPDTGEGMQAKSIELSAYLPFDEDSQIVKLDSETKFTEDIPVIDGAAALYPVFSAFVNAVYPESAVNFDGQTFTADSCLQMNNTRGAYKAVVDHTVDIAICAGPSEEQSAYAEEQGVELALVPIGREAFVFLVNSSNPVDTLTQEQIRGIYTGTYRRWSELGGKNVRISALQRNAGSGSQTTFLKFMGDETPVRDFDSFLGSSIGFSFRYYVEGVVANGGVKMLAVDGVYPSTENVSNGSYPLVSDFYAVYDKANTNANVTAFVDWMLGAEGQEIIEQTGYSAHDSERDPGQGISDSYDQ